ncbi:MerR family transcriptional regulator [Actinomadura rubrisoli]|uniref:MerR family transcriptional regulator n=1 Tax=Actinomadura rubrisoli TaxID=2530368 RepID=A0A4R5C216_9ACTN|nr:MerR family transcriptional regulator [Actinomadura rubrisoli]TDD93648.1 MerR family transcriptional regulator [Actinomadura rubrisoli]
MNTRQLLDHVPGLTYRQLDLWTRSGYLHALQAGPGSGHARRYSRDEVEVAALMVRLHAAGLNVQTAHHAARELAAGRPAVLAPGIEITVAEPPGGVAASA